MRYLWLLILLSTLLTGCAAGAGPKTATALPITVAPTSQPATGTPLPPPDVTFPPLTLVPSPTAANDESTEYIVRPGDTLLGIASTFDLPMAAIQLSNGMGESTVVRVGQVLTIPSRAAWEGASRFWVVHVVKEGETLAGIARAYGLDVGALVAVNGLADADMLRVGQELVLPLESPPIARAIATDTPPPPTDTPLPLPTATTAATTLPTPSSVPLSSPAPPPADAGDWPHETARLINEVRARYGFPPLAYNEALAAAAQAQAADCAERGWCSHTGSDGSDIKTRLIRAGYDPSGWAECWAQQLSPQGAVDIWMDEVPPNDPHRRTLLTTWLSEIGVGVAQTNWGYYFIADFGRP